MRFMKRIGAVAVAAVMMVSVAGCSSGSTQTTSSAAAASSTASTAFTSKVSITVCDLVTDDTGINKFLKQRQADFATKYPNITVNHIAASTSTDAATSMVQTVTTLFMSSDAPVYYGVSSVFYAKDLYNLGVAADISSLKTAIRILQTSMTQ
jgi:ABC-type glycerol-3-phosphate transport system substrate-binding protein